MVVVVVVVDGVVLVEEVHAGHVEEGLEGVGGAEELGEGGPRVAVERVVLEVAVVVVVVSVVAAEAGAA